VIARVIGSVIVVSVLLRVAKKRATALWAWSVRSVGVSRARMDDVHAKRTVNCI
jgi:hypothetical protein